VKSTALPSWIAMPEVIEEPDKAKWDCMAGLMTVELLRDKQ
jgi:hypothetical protein